MATFFQGFRGEEGMIGVVFDHRDEEVIAGTAPLLSSKL
jgi:hypothetical protein